MGKTVILGIDELASGQAQAFNTVNDMVAALEQAHNRIKQVSITTADVTLPTTDFIRNKVFRVSGLTADRTLKLPVAQNGNPSNRDIVVINASNYALTVTTATDGGSTVVIPPSFSREIHMENTTLTPLTEGGPGLGVESFVALFTAGLPTHDTEILRYVFPGRVRWSGSSLRGSVKTAPSPGAALFFYKNGTYIGRARVTAGGTFTFEGALNVDWVAQDVLTVKYFALQVGTVTLNSVADTGDTLTINDGSTSVTFTFGGGVGQVIPGASANDSAIALEAAINASALASTVVVSRSTNVLTIWNLRTARGGTITKSDADNDYTVVDFAIDGSSENWAVTMPGARY